MLRLFKLCLAMGAFLVFAWFGMTVKLGPRTLFQHLRAIGQTKESQDLVDGTREAAEPLVDDVRRRIGRPAAAPGPATAARRRSAPASSSTRKATSSRTSTWCAA